METDELAALSGAVVRGFEVGESASQVTLTLKDGRRAHLTLDGDCCSTSHFTDPKQFQDLVGTTILRAEDREGQSHNNLPTPEDADCISWHFLVFTTNTGHVTIDWHNNSNGYYDGALYVQIEEGGTEIMKAAKNPGVSIHDAISVMQNDLEEFVVYWERKRREDPDNYPLEYPSQEEWEDQFRAWLDLKSLGEGA